MAGVVSELEFSFGLRSCDPGQQIFVRLRCAESPTSAVWIGSTLARALQEVVSYLVPEVAAEAVLPQLPVPYRQALSAWKTSHQL